MGGLLLRPGFFTGSCPARARADQPKASTAKTTARAGEIVITSPRTYRPLTGLKATKPALMIQLKKSGKSQQARKEYKVTAAGVKYIEGILNEKG
jgi:hypothetical protein